MIVSPFFWLGKADRNALAPEYYQADKHMMWILLAHGLVAIFVTSNYYNTHWLGTAGSLLIMSLCTAAFVTLRGTLWFRLIAGVAVMFFSALYIQQHLGRIEMHFHVFIGLAILSIYKDIMPMLTGSMAIIMHHFLFNWFQSQNLTIDGHPIMIFSYGCGIEYVYLHGIMVAAEAIVIGFIIQSSTKQYLELRRTKEALDHSNEQLNEFNTHLEEQIETRTLELATALQKQIELSQELKRAEQEAVSANRLKSEFLANMSHEIRTPLNAVIGFAELLEQKIQEPKHRGYLQAIKNGGRNLLSLINDILDLSKIESGHMKIELHPLNLRSFLKEITQLFEASARAKGLVVECSIDPDAPEWIVADEMHIRQILLNLLSNAIKFTEEGNVTLKISANSWVGDGSVELAFAVHDSGIGILPKDQEKIFDAFVQNEGQDTRKYGGTGLGLSICRKLAHLMGGEMTLESTIGVGSTFTLKLSNVEISEPLFTDEDFHRNSYDYRFEKAHILVVDDIIENRLLLREFLEEYGFEIDEASDGMVALEKINAHAYDLILMDIRMPNLDGWETIRILRNEYRSTIPVIAVTASVMKHDYDRIVAVFDAMLEKPVSKNALMARIGEFLPHTLHNLTPQESSDTLNLSDERYKEVREELLDLIPQIDHVLKSGDMQAALETGAVFETIGEGNAISEIALYGRRLREGAEGFDVESVERLLRYYSNYLKEWGIE